MRFQPLYDAAHVLRPVLRTNQKSIGRIHDHEIVYAHGGYKLFWAPQKISFRFERNKRTCGYISTVARTVALRQEFVNRLPRTDVAPADGRRQHKDLLVFMARRRFEHRIIDRNVLELWIDTLQRPGVTRCS